MNRIGKKEIAPDAARLFESELLELNRDIPREELCAMVDDYIYYQTDDMSRQEAHSVVDDTCRTVNGANQDKTRINSPLFPYTITSAQKNHSARDKARGNVK